MDTGAMYRAFAWRVREEGIDLGDEDELKKILAETWVELREADGRLRVMINGLDVTDRIRTPEVSQLASKVSALKMVRQRMVELQRAMGSQGGVVAEGRDIGTVVFPDADVKIYLDASTGERGRRRFEELRSQGRELTLGETIEDMEERDRRDTGRAIAPLIKAKDAIVIDSTHLGVDALVARIMDEIRSRAKELP